MASLDSDSRLSKLNRKIVSRFCTQKTFAFPQPGVILCDTVRGVTSPACRLPTSSWEELCPVFVGTPVVLTGVLLLVPGLAHAQSTSSEDRAPALSATVGAAQPTPVTRHWRNEWFRDRDYFDPLIAEPRAPQIAFTFPAWIPELEFSVEPGTRLAWEVSLGREIPIFTRANFDDATRALEGFAGLRPVGRRQLPHDRGHGEGSVEPNHQHRLSLQPRQAEVLPRHLGLAAHAPVPIPSGDGNRLRSAAICITTRARILATSSSSTARARTRENSSGRT